MLGLDPFSERSDVRPLSPEIRSSLDLGRPWDLRLVISSPSVRLMMNARRSVPVVAILIDSYVIADQIALGFRLGRIEEETRRRVLQILTPATLAKIRLV
jgi:hypothetical protein